MTTNTPVIVVEPDSCFFGRRGIVVATSPNLRVLLDGETKSLMFGSRELAPIPEEVT